MEASTGGGTGVVSFSIRADGESIPTGFQVYSIRIDAAANAMGRAEIVLLDGNATMESFPVSDSKIFAPGNAIEISLGYDGVNRPVFSGIVASQALAIDTASGPMVTIECCDGASPQRVEKSPELSISPDLVVTYGVNLFELQASLDTGNISPSKDFVPTHGRLKIQGTDAAKVGGAVALRGVGSRFSGLLSICGVTHEMSNGFWSTSIDFGQPAGG